MLNINRNNIELISKESNFKTNIGKSQGIVFSFLNIQLLT